MKAARVWTGGMALGLVQVHGISPLIRPASPTLSKKAMRLIRPPKGVMGFAVEVSRTADLGRWDYKNFTSFGEGGVVCGDSKQPLLPHDL